MSQPYSQGPRLSEPSGDPCAQAVASLRGYAYQLYASGLAWLDVGPSQELWLEVAQDYAVAAEEALRAVQVKDTSASITINSEAVRDALDGFVDLVERNPDRQVYLQFLSTCAIGREQKLEHRAGGEATLHYWRRAAAGADVSPLRAILDHIALSDRARNFIATRDDTTLRDEFLRRIQWSCGRQPLEGVKRELEEGLLHYHVEHFHAPAQRERLADAVVQRILLTIAEGGRRRLDGRELLTLVTDTASVLVPRTGFEAMMNRLTHEESMGEPTAPPSLLERESELPFPPVLAARVEVTTDLRQRVLRHGVTFVTGATGTGKTTVARLMARLEDTPWCILDLRESTAEQITSRLNAALSELVGSDWRGLILDDLNEIEDPAVRRSLVRFLAALHRHDMLCLITAYRPPSSRAFSDLGLDQDAQLSVPDMSLVEIAAMVSEAGDADGKWPEAIQRASAGGHPQCVQAIISGLRRRGWPAEELATLLTFEPAADLEAERRAARSRIVAVLSAEAARFLYRISLLFGRFDRPLALKLGTIDPVIGEPGLQLDQLIGPWVELTALRDMRVSPLLEKAGAEILTSEETGRVHETAALHLLGSRSLGIDKVDFGFLHALAAEQGWLLTRLAYNIIAASAKVRRQISAWMDVLREYRLDQPIFPANPPGVTILLRLAQFVLIAANGRAEAIRNCWRRLQTELAELDDVEAREHFEGLILFKALFLDEAVALLPDPVRLMLRFATLCERNSVWRPMLEDRIPAPDGRRRGLLGTLFMNWALRVSGVDDLEQAFTALAAATPEHRAALLEYASDGFGEAGHVVNHGWLEESKRDATNWRAHLAAYGRMAGQAEAWGYRELSICCHIARSIILDEYLSDADGGLRALDDAEAILQSDAALDRARAKIFYRRKDHVAALRLFREGADRMEVEQPTARTYMLREAAISAAEIGEWTEAREWFAAARRVAAHSPFTDSKLMAVGLHADEALAAYKAGDVGAALQDLNSALDEIEAVDPTSSVAAGYRHRVIRHSILWLFGQLSATKVDTAGDPLHLVPGMCSNPEPADLSDMPLGVANYARYLLVQAEIASGLDAGLEQGLRGRLKCGTIPDMECLLVRTRMQFLARRLDAERYVAALPALVDCQIYVEANGEAMLRSGPENPAYGEIPRAKPEQLSTDRAIFSAEDALLSFGILAALRKEPDALSALCVAAARIQDGYSGKRILQVLVNGRSEEDNLAHYVAGEICRLASQPVLVPDELFVTSLRFVQWANRSHFKDVLISPLELWIRSAWDHAIEEQRFNLRNPASSVPPIREVLDAADTGLNFMGRLVVAALSAVHHRLDGSFREFLLSL